MQGTVRYPVLTLIGGIVLVALVGCTAASAPATPLQETLDATPSPASLADATAMPLPSGRYVTDGAFAPRLGLVLPHGWSINDYGTGRVSLVKSTADGSLNAAFVSFYLVTGVYADPCGGGTPVAAPPGAEALVAALRAQPGFAVGPLSEGTLDGKETWSWEVTPKVDVSTCANDPWLYQWQFPAADGDSAIDAGTIDGAVQRLTVVDLDGTPLIAEVGLFEWTTEADAVEADDLVRTVSFE